MTKKEIVGWVECISKDRRIPKDVREMCADICKTNAVRAKQGEEK